VVEAVVFDLDGVLVDSEQLWDTARREVAAEHGGRWKPAATAAMQGMSSPEWASYMRSELGVKLSEREVTEEVVAKLLGRYRDRLPLLPGAAEAVRRLAQRWPLAIASSANRPVIDEVLRLSGLAGFFAATVSSEEVAHGKPAPDVYLEAARRLGQPPSHCAAVEDSGNGILAALAAGLVVVAVPNRWSPPPKAVLERAPLVIGSLDELDTSTVERAERARAHAIEQRLDEQEIQSFPASDPHSDWPGPPA
jgi:HAD superfamily hydrolase (TIGR01509 family)